MNALDYKTDYRNVHTLMKWISEKRLRITPAAHTLETAREIREMVAHNIPFRPLVAHEDREGNLVIDQSLALNSLITLINTESDNSLIARVQGIEMQLIIIKFSQRSHPSLRLINQY